MGTRNKTYIIYKGRKVIDFYGQWDGHLTTAGVGLVEFLRNEENIEDLKKALEVVKPYSNNSAINESFIGYDDLDGLNRTGNLLFDHYKEQNELSNNLSAAGAGALESYIKAKDLILIKYGLTPAEAAKYQLRTRDTGYHIPMVLVYYYRQGVHPLSVFSEKREASDIEARYTIDLDNREIKMEWHDHAGIFPFNNLPTEEQLEKLQDKIDSGEEINSEEASAS